jgi:hypothetical protein
MTLPIFLNMRARPGHGGASSAPAVDLTYAQTIDLDSPTFAIPMQEVGPGSTSPNLYGDDMLFPGDSANPAYDQPGPGFEGGEDSYRWINATAEYLVEPSGAHTDFDLNSGSFTIEAWVNLATGNNTGADRKTVAYRRVPGGGREDFYFGFGDGAARNIHFYTGGTNLETVEEIPTGWVHIAGVRNGTLATVYINGVASVTTVNNSTNSGGAGGQFLVGTVPGVGSQRYKGYIAWLAGYKGQALSAARILAHYNAGV